MGVPEARQGAAAVDRVRGPRAGPGSMYLKKRLGAGPGAGAPHGLPDERRLHGVLYYPSMCVYIYIYIHTYIHYTLYTNTNADICIYIYIHMYMCVYVYVYIYIYIYIHIHIHSLNYLLYIHSEELRVPARRRWGANWPGRAPGSAIHIIEKEKEERKDMVRRMRVSE